MTAALVHDHLIDFRGPERTFEAIAEVWPDAPIYTLVYDERSTDGCFSHHDVRSALGEGRRVRQRGVSRLRPLFPAAIRRLPVWEHDLVVSSSSAYALGVHHRDDAVHVCYCHSVDREAWADGDRAGAGPWISRPLVRMRQARKRRSDRQAATRVTAFVANSELTRARVAECLGRDSTVIHPPVEVDRFEPGEPEDYFLVVAELWPHKRVDVALEAARLADRRVVVVGSGPEYRRLHARYGKRAEFVRRLRDEELARLYAGARALIVANVEEFGIAAVEAQAAGRPVVGVDAGGLQETVVPDVTGVLVPDGGPDPLAQALRDVDFTRFDPGVIHRHAQQFSRPRFQRELRRYVAEVQADGDAR